MEEKRENMGFAFWQNVDRFRKERTIAEIARSEGLKYQRLKEQRSDNTLPRADYAYLIEHAREMRKESTQAEDVLWQALRNSQLGSKWRRQHPV